MLDDMGWYLSIPFMLIAVLGYLITMIGWPLLASGVVALFKIRFDMYLANANKEIWEEQNKIKDKRVNLLNEALTNIRMMKLYSWTDSIIANIDIEREKELALRKRA